MKLFLKTTKYVSEIVPRARITWLTNIDQDGKIIDKVFIVRTPIRQWRKFINPWSFQHDSGWCTYTFFIRFGRRMEWHSMWEPLDTSDWV